MTEFLYNHCWGCHDEVSLNKVSMNIIPGRCVPTLDRIQTVGNHNSYTKKFNDFPVPSRDVTNQTLSGRE